MDEIFSILTSGKILSTKFENQQDWINNSVVELDEENSIIKVYISKDYLEGIITAGESIQMKKSSGGNIYDLRGIIVDVIDYSPQKFEVKLNSLQIINRSIELRDNTRFTVKLECNINSSNMIKSESLQVANISWGGVRLVGSHQNLKIGETIFIDVFYDANEFFKLKGEIVNKKVLGYDIEYGVKSNPINSADKTYLDGLLNKLGQMFYEETEKISAIKKLRNRTSGNN